MLASRFKIKLILGSDEILHTYNHNSPANNYHQLGSIEGALEQSRELHYLKYLAYLRWLGFIESLCIVIGVVWSTTILIYNTGDFPDNKMAKYLKDRNSLSTTLAVTFIIPFILCFIHLIVRIIFANQARKNMQEQGSLAD